MHLKYRNVNDAFVGLVSSISTGKITTRVANSRAGDVLQIEEPVIVTYERPIERVLFNQARDCNPFFHLFESLWMLAGRNDVAPLAYFSSKIGEVASDDGKTFNGAYGYRWRHAPDMREEYREEWSMAGLDQLNFLVDYLKRKPDTRRAVLQMWDVNDDLLKVDETKDVCCNTAAYFSLRDRGAPWPSMEGSSRYLLEMTVTNRSNDLTWGMLGANVVHFSILQEYMAAKIGVGLGVYHQFTNNLHAYLSRWEPEKWLEGYDPKTRDQFSPKLHGYNNDVKTVMPLVHDVATFDREVVRFVDEKENGVYSDPFLRFVAEPMCLAFAHHKNRDYDHALSAMSFVRADDWRIAGENWLKKRQLNYESKKETTDVQGS